MKLSEELVWRGMKAEHTFKDPSELDERSRKFYWGVDPSADSMTIGNLAALMQAKVFIKHGYEPFLLAGGATGQIGDPKDTGERDLKTLDEVAANVAGIEGQFKRIVGGKFTLVNNADWFRNINYIEFLREVGKHFSMTQLLDRQFVQARIGEGSSGISYAEFSYTLIQGYDFLHLYREYGVELQLCGADQFGNCVSGMHLIKRLENAEVDVWSMPLVIDKVSGRKFGKSEGNAIWLAEERTSVFDFYQFWLNQADGQVEEFLRQYTELGRDEVEAVMLAHAERPSERVAQKRLAHEVTKVVHGGELADQVMALSEVLFGGEGSGAVDVEAAARHLPRAKAGEVLDVLTDYGMSRGEAKRMIEQGGVRLRADDGDYVKTSFGQEVPVGMVLKLGKNKFLMTK
ncbi:tyrosine--tRNA ligase [Candidatus Saccharibacteria bacterium]|nr:tyrosine--tRNA ligase [Candidatus Saccharibacteria bacterium]